MCCGSGSSDAPAPVAMTAMGEVATNDTTRYRVMYLNGTHEFATGIDDVRRLLINLDARAQDTDKVNLGGSYAPA